MTSDDDIEALEKFLLIRKEEAQNGLACRTTAHAVFSEILRIKNT